MGRRELKQSMLGTALTFYIPLQFASWKSDGGVNAPVSLKHYQNTMPLNI